MRRLLVILALTFGSATFAGVAGATHGSADDASPNMPHLANLAKPGTINSDLAFHHNLAVAGNYDGFRLIDIKDPANPVVVSDFHCHGPQNDVSFYKARNRLLVITSIDTPQTTADCATSADTPLSPQPLPPPFPPGAVANLRAPGFEGLRIFDVTNPESPQQIASVPTACGSHTHTTITDDRNQRAIIYVSSYPLGAGRTPAGFPDFGGPRCHVPHGKISIVEIPDANPEAAHVLKEQPLDADTLPFLGSLQEGGTGAVGCHDIQAFLDPKVHEVAAACMSEGQLWDISDPANPTTIGPRHTHIRNPNFDFWHSAEFTWDAKVVMFGDEAFEDGECQSQASLKGNIWFYENVPPGTATSPLLGRYMIPRPQPASEYCSAHMFNVIPVTDRYIGVSAFYEGGNSVFDFTNPAAPVEIAHFDEQGVDGNGRDIVWSTYWYNNFIYANGGFGFGPYQRGLDVYELLTPDLTRQLRARKFHHMNPQTQEVFQTIGR
jgi:hypothetical protein